MTNIHFTAKRGLTLLACASLMSLLAACGSPHGGYYNENGDWIATDTPHNMKSSAHAPDPGSARHYPDRPVVQPYAAYRYDRRGYYTPGGYYADIDDGVPEGMFPPRGMCRVWFTDRAPSRQPPVESCTGIEYRVPAGAYVIYGG